MESHQRSELRSWERTVLVVFGLWLVGAEFGQAWLDRALAVAGVAIVIAAVGAVELAMASFYRTQRARRARRHP